MKAKFFLVAFLTLVGYDYCVAQESNQTTYDLREHIIQPSPEAASLGKYGAVPVSYYTGRTQTQIPLYQIVEKDIELSVALSYFGGGIKVEELASSVGLGWSLNAGGVITRSVKGRADDLYNGYLSSSYTDGPKPNALDMNFDDRLKLKMADGWVDGESDVYYYNFNGKSGSFFFDNQGKAYGYEFNKMKIVPTLVSGKIEAFIITDENGFEYTFSQRERQSSCSDCQVGANPANINCMTEEYTSAWFLSKIKSAKNAVVTFTYEDYKTTRSVMGTEKKYNLDKTQPYYLDPNVETSAWFPKRDIICRTILTNYSKQIRSIEFSNGTVEFLNTEARADLPGAKALKGIIIKNSEGYTVKSLDLSYSYYSGRMMLHEVKEKNGAVSKQPYAFQYYENGSLPSNLSYAQDHWGYYNGKLSNKSLVPSLVINGNIRSGANRDVDTVFSKLGSLQKIIYPTGGSTTFEYEQNQANNEWPLYNLLSQNVRYDIYPESAKSFVGTSDQPVETERRSFSIENIGSNPNGVWTDMTMVIPYRFSADYINSSNAVAARFEVWDLDKNALKASIFDFGDPVSVQGITDKDSLYTYKLPYKMFLENGNYAIIHKIIPNKYSIHSIPYNFSIVWEQNDLNSRYNKLVGGIRVRKITDYDPLSGKSVNRHFKYKEGENSSGALMNFPKYFYTYKEFIDNYMNSVRKQFGGTYIVGVTNSLNYLGTTSGATVGYSNVEEILDDGSKTVYKYTSAKDYPDRVELNRTNYTIDQLVNDKFLDSHPEAEYRSYDWKRGLLTETSQYLKSGDKYQPVRRELRKYTFYDAESAPANNYGMDYNIKVSIYENDRRADEYLGQVILINHGPIEYYIMPGFMPTFRVNYYYNRTGYTLLDSVITEEYSQDDMTQFITQVETYTYNNSNLRPAQITRIDSRQNTNVQKITYAQDWVVAGKDPEGVYQGIVERNILNTVVEEERLLNGRSMDLVKTNYFEPFQSIFVPYSKEVKVGDSPIEERLRYLEYDSKGNLLSYSKDDTAPFTYLWGYNDSYPIAEIQNASVSEVNRAVAAQNLTFVDASGKMLPDPMLRAELDKLRAGLPNAIITTYTYDPLVGVTSTTDPNRRTTYYDYDLLGRLQAIKDDKGNVLKAYQYNYRHRLK